MKKAFINPDSGELKCHGFVETNVVGDIGIDVPDEFNLMPGEWRWSGKEFVPYEKPIPYEERRRVEYEKRGLSIERLVVALIENDAAELQTIRTLRAEVKQAIPKDK